MVCLWLIIRFDLDLFSVKITEGESFRFRIFVCLRLSGSWFLPVCFSPVKIKRSDKPAGSFIKTVLVSLSVPVCLSVWSLWSPGPFGPLVLYVCGAVIYCV